MKKKILTLGLFVAMMLGAAASNDTERCETFHLYCPNGSTHTGMICGTHQDHASQMLVWIEVLCQ